METIDIPQPIIIDGDKKLWIIDGYKVWATTFDEALEILKTI